MTLPRPRRLTPPAPYGSQLKCNAVPAPPRKTESGKDADYLALIRQLPCLYCGVEPCGEAAHVRLASAAFGKSSGLGKKPDDCWALPLCGEDHRNARHAQHKRSEAEFWASLGINPLIVCERLFKQRGDYAAMRMVIVVAISERSKM
ncbi:MAG TPA: hypothetical protein VEU47_11025 [Candidatus Cybelea sp.]|nr:hypothetical protein [Candidatus Cybelea sp.]